MEDIGEKPYRVDAMLTQLKNSGKLADCAGIILGYWTDCQADDPAKSLSLDEIFDEIIKPLGIPAVKGLCCGHDLPSSALPLGAMVSLDAEACTLIIEEG